MILYRAVSAREYRDYKTDQTFRTTERTLEAKQFFKSELAVRGFVEFAIERGFKPPYKYILSIEIDNQDLNSFDLGPAVLDDHEAVTIQSEDLSSFNNCVTFVLEQHV